MARTLFIWDIHGCYDELIDLYGKMQVSEHDTVYATGDLINKWPFSQKVVQFLREKNIQSVLGNHDIKFLKCMNGIDEKTDWFDGVMEQFRWCEHDLEYIQWLTHWIETDDFLLLHAGLRPDKKTLSEQSEEESIMRIRLYNDKPWHDFYDWEKIIIYGHWAEQWLRFTRNTRWLDSGCVWWGHLTGYCLETGDIWQVRAKKAYADYWNDKN